jgi:hypothetical protein
MPRKAQTHGIDDSFDTIITRFATELRQAVVGQVAGAIGEALHRLGAGTAAAATPARETTPATASVPKAKAARKPTKKIVVHCPVPGCKNPGVRTLMNFCVEHNRSLPKAERVRLREEQKRAQEKAGAKAKPRRAAAAKKKPAVKKAKARPVSRSAAKTNEAKRIAGTKLVACPVEGCKKPGVRRFSNFCVEHHKSVGKAEQKRLRATQRKAQAEATAT